MDGRGVFGMVGDALVRVWGGVSRSIGHDGVQGGGVWGGRGLGHPEGGLLEMAISVFAFDGLMLNWITGSSLFIRVHKFKV